MVISCYAVEEFGRKYATSEQILYNYLPKLYIKITLVDIS
jgi:hypothetical protein